MVPDTCEPHLHRDHRVDGARGLDHLLDLAGFNPCRVVLHRAFAPEIEGGEETDSGNKQEENQYFFLCQLHGSS